MGNIVNELKECIENGEVGIVEDLKLLEEKYYEYNTTTFEYFILYLKDVIRFEIEEMGEKI